MQEASAHDGKVAGSTIRKQSNGVHKLKKQRAAVSDNTLWGKKKNRTEVSSIILSNSLFASFLTHPSKTGEDREAVYR